MYHNERGGGAYRPIALAQTAGIRIVDTCLVSGRFGADLGLRWPPRIVRGIGMDVAAFLSANQASSALCGPAGARRGAAERERAGSRIPSDRCLTRLQRLLAAQGIEQLYEHQAQALDAARAGTGSGRRQWYGQWQDTLLQPADPGDLSGRSRRHVRSTSFRPKRWPKTSSKVNSN